MKKCEECGKNLGILKGYRHPTLGKSHVLCSPCFGRVSESVEKWSKAVLPYVDFFNNGTSNRSLQSDWKNKLKDFIQIQKTIGKAVIKKEI